jgi:hypothetical protein
LEFVGQNILNLIAALSAIIAVVFAVRKLTQWILPIRVYPGIFVGIDGNFIRATITNRSSEPQFIISCRAMGTYPFSHIALIHIRNPFIRPRLYQNVRYGGVVYDLLEQGNIKMEALQPIELSHKLKEHPLSAVHTPYFIIEVKLSSGKIVKSNKMPVPTFWSKIGSNRLQEKCT